MPMFSYLHCTLTLDHVRLDSPKIIMLANLTDNGSLLLFYITHTASRGTAGALVSHAILQDMHSFQRSITGKRDKNKALMSIYLKELLKKRQTSLTW